MPEYQPPCDDTFVKQIVLPELNANDSAVCSIQQLKTKIAILVSELQMSYSKGDNYGVSVAIKKLRQLSVV